MLVTIAVILAVVLLVHASLATYTLAGVYAVLVFIFQIRSQYSFLIALSLFLIAAVVRLTGGLLVAQQIDVFGLYVFSIGIVSLLLDNKEDEFDAKEGALIASL